MNIFIANWKMNMTAKDVITWTDTWKSLDKTPLTTKKIILAPSHPHLYLANNLDGIEVAAQDISLEEKGAHTGEVGVFQLHDYCKYAIIGHSERKEKKEDVLKKMQMCLSVKITPIICFIDLTEVSDYLNEGVILAWEDPTNISVQGEYNPKATTDIEYGIQKIREVIGNTAKLVYGGSVNTENVSELSSLPKLDGVLVGNASLNCQSFYEICRS